MYSDFSVTVYFFYKDLADIAGAGPSTASSQSALDNQGKNF